MTDREKVIQALEQCAKWQLKRKADKYVVMLDIRFVNSILALLKEQEAVNITTDYVDGFGNPIANCPSCKSRLFWSSNKHYCGECGQPVLWEGR